MISFQRFCYDSTKLKAEIRINIYFEVSLTVASTESDC